MPLPTLRHQTALARWAALAVVVSGFAIASSAYAQDVPRPPEDRASAEPVADPPARVGRLTALQGAVSFEPASDTEWGAAEANRPVTTGDRIWSDTAGRAEIEMGTAAARVWHETEIDVTRLDDNSLQLRIPQGTVTVRLSTFTDGETAEIDAPNAAVTISATGEYRVDVSPDGATTTVTVRSGSAEVTSAGSSFSLAAHQLATIQGDSAPTYNVAEEGAADDFDQWVSARDEVADRAPRRYVPSDMPGVEDLDDNGSWDNDADYGPVWYPTVVEAGWAPYHTGHWAWIGPWGWTWVDDASWGWAPFHYGRWAYVHSRWGWCPGRVIASAVYAPGLVVFAGGAGWGASAAFGPGGGVGWFPLGPEEVYRPEYRVSPAYVRRVNITNVTNINNITIINNNVTNVTYRNRDVGNAFMAVPRQSFISAQPVARASVRLPEDQIRSATIVGAAPQIVPTHESLIANAGGRTFTRPPVEVARRPVVAVHAPPPRPVPFSAQEHALASSGGRPLAPAQLATLRQSTPVPNGQPSRTTLIRSAAAQPAQGATLKPARAGLPAAHPVFQTGVVSRAMTPPPAAGARPAIAQPPSAQVTARAPEPPQAAEPRPAPQATEPRPVQTPAPSEAAGTRVTVPAPVMQSRPPAARPAVRAASPSLNASYVAERTQMEDRHVQQFAKPAAGVTPDALAERQQTEHNDLDARYHQAAAAGKPTMAPPRPAARSAPPRAAPRAAPAPAPRKK
jgi:hypothetical protein